MDQRFVDECPMSFLLRWAGRLMSFGLIVMIGQFMYETAGPSPFRLTGRDIVLMPIFVVAVLGLLIAWRWQTAGAVMAVGGVAVLYAGQWLLNGESSHGGAFLLIALPGLMWLTSAGCQLLYRSEQRRLFQSLGSA